MIINLSLIVYELLQFIQYNKAIYLLENCNICDKMNQIVNLNTRSKLYYYDTL